MPFTTQRTILFGDCDPAGIIFTPRVAYFVIEAVHEFLSHILNGPAIRGLFAMGILPPARALSIEYLTPMIWDDVIDVRVDCETPKNSSFTFLLAGHNAAGEATFRASLTQVCISPETKRPIPIPDILRQALLNSMQ